MRTMMRSAAEVGLVIAAAMTVGTMSTLAARAGSGAVAARPTDASATGTGAGVRIEISDDTRSAHSGDVVDYTVRVDNESAASSSNLEVYHLVPAGFQLVDSSPRASQDGGTVRWTADVPAGHTAVFTDQVMAGTVEETEHLAPRARDAAPADTLAHPFTSTACARRTGSGVTLACGTVREQLADAPDAASAVAGAGDRRWQPGLLGVGVIAALYAAFGGLRRKRKDQPEEE